MFDRVLNMLLGMYHSNRQVILARYSDIYRLKSTPQTGPCKKNLYATLNDFLLYIVDRALKLQHVCSNDGFSGNKINYLKKAFSWRKYETYSLEIRKVYCSQVQFLSRVATSWKNLDFKFLTGKPGKTARFSKKTWKMLNLVWKILLKWISIFSVMYLISASSKSSVLHVSFKMWFRVIFAGFIPD